ncbi:neuronal acetylcholine receptor subunit beta-3-like [Glandiceps talaboti]
MRMGTVSQASATFLCLQALLLTSLTSDALGTILSDEIKRLQTDLFADYSKHVMPVNESGVPLTMYFGLSVNQIMDVDEKNQLITTRVWLNQYWIDFRLQWDPANYSDIESVSVPFDWLWYPDLVLDNSGDGEQLLPTWKYATVYYYGEIWMVPPAKLVSPCAIDVTYFPFDHQRCPLSFGPWDFDASQIVLQPVSHHVPKENYIDNVEWTFPNESQVEAYLDFDDCCPDEAYSVIRYTLHFQRRALYYVLNIVLPCVAFSFLTVFTFYMPSDSGEKMTICISILIALSIFSLLVAEIMPATSETSPLIGTYLLFVMCITAAAVIMTVIIINIRHRSARQYRMSPWVRKVFLQILPKYLLLGDDFTKDPTPDESDQRSSVPRNCVAPSTADFEIQRVSQCTDLENPQESMSYLELDKRDDSKLIDKDVKSNGLSAQNMDKNGSMTAVREVKVQSDIDNLERLLLKLMELQRPKLKKTLYAEKIVKEWKHLAIVVDRISVWFFALITLIGSFSLLFQRS